MCGTIQNIPIMEVNILSQTNRLSCSIKERKISLELAFDTILRASTEEILDTLKKVPCEETASLVIAIGRIWQGSK